MGYKSFDESMIQRELRDKKKFRVSFAFLFSVSLAFLFSVSLASAATNISSNAAEHWAWNDVIGWIDFYYTNNVNVTISKIEGYASSSVGHIAFDCATSPSPPAGCDTTYSNWKVSNDGNGNLSGWAWSEGIGWISFDCHNPETGGTAPDYSCIQSLYQVKIDGSGNFSGWAWNDVIGWFSFNCNNSGIGDTCASGGGYDYKVKTSWVATAITGTLLSSIFDTGVANGAAFNSIMWKGLQPAGTAVKFQFASSNSPSSFPEPVGPNGTSLATDTYNPTGPNASIALNRLYHNNHRYYRYKIILETNITRTLSPRADDVFVNWSP